jgi:hypothetical protein
MSSTFGAPPRRNPFAAWLASDWTYVTETEARRRARPIWGVVAWLVFNVVMAVYFHAVSVVGLPLVLLWLLQMRGQPSRSVAVLLLALSAFVAVLGWTHGIGEWASGDGEFKLLLVLFTARCVWAELALPRVRRREAWDVFG